MFDLKSGAKKVRQTVLYLDIFYVSFIVHLQAFAATTLSRIAASHTIPKAQGLWLWLSDCCLLNVFLETLLKRIPGTVSNSEQQ